MKKNNPKRSLVSSFEMMYQIMFQDIDGNDPYEQMKTVADALIDGVPVLAHFNNIHDAEAANYILAFLSGVSYTLKGNSFKVSEETYLFTSEECMKDGSIKSYLNEVVNK